jgi:putative ABC transport system permease protein
MIDGRPVPLTVVAVLHGLPTGIAAGPVVLVGYDLEQAASTIAMVRTDVFTAGTPAGLAALQHSRPYSDPATTVTLEKSLHRGADSRPLGALIQRIQVAETTLEAALCALAVLLTLAIGAAARGRAAAFLATMGFGRGRLRWIAVVETLPVLLLVTAGGIGTGISVVPVLAGSIDLPALTGLTTQLRVRADPATIAAAAAAVPGMTLAAVFAERFLRRRLGIVTVLRAGDR